MKSGVRVIYLLVFLIHKVIYACNLEKRTLGKRYLLGCVVSSNAPHAEHNKLCTLYSTSWESQKQLINNATIWSKSLYTLSILYLSLSPIIVKTFRAELRICEECGMLSLQFCSLLLKASLTEVIGPWIHKYRRLQCLKSLLITKVLNH